MAREAANVGRSSHYRWKEADPVYEEAFEMAKEDAADILEAEAKRRAVDGDDVKDRLQQDDGRTAFPHRGSRAIPMPFWRRPVIYSSPKLRSRP